MKLLWWLQYTSSECEWAVYDPTEFKFSGCFELFFGVHWKETIFFLSAGWYVGEVKLLWGFLKYISGSILI